MKFFRDFGFVPCICHFQFGIYEINGFGLVWVLCDYVVWVRGGMRGGGGK